MTRNPLQTTMINSVGHKDTTLEVEFSNGAIYHYFNVTKQEYKALLAADRPNIYFTSNIKPKNYKKV